MSYQTRAEVVSAAAESEEAAIKSSVRHWKEIVGAPIRDMRAGLGINGHPLDASHCALCCRYSGQCECCPFSEFGDTCCECGSSYELVCDVYNNISNLPNHNMTAKRKRDAAIKRFRRRAKKMLRILEGLL